MCYLAADLPGRAEAGRGLLGLVAERSAAGRPVVVHVHVVGDRLGLRRDLCIMSESGAPETAAATAFFWAIQPPESTPVPRKHKTKTHHTLVVKSPLAPHIASAVRRTLIFSRADCGADISG